MPRPSSSLVAIWMTLLHDPQLRSRPAGSPQHQSCHPVVWRGPESIPAPKWMTETVTLTDEETEDWVATVFVQAGAEPKPRGDPKAFMDFVDLLESLRAIVAKNAA